MGDATGWGAEVLGGLTAKVVLGLCRLGKRVLTSDHYTKKDNFVIRFIVGCRKEKRSAGSNYLTCMNLDNVLPVQ